MNIVRGYHALKSFFFSESSRGLNSEDEFIILMMALIRVQTHNGSTTVPFGTYIPASGKEGERGKKIWNNRHKYGMDLYSEGVSCGECEDRVYGQRLCTGELWEFIMNSVTPYKINLFPYCLGIWYIMRAMFVVFFSPSLALKTRVGSFFLYFY